MLQDEKVLIILLISLLLNISAVGLGGILTWRRGGFYFLQSKLFPAASDLPARSPYYQHRKHQFEQLAISPDSIVFLGDSITDEGEWSEWLSQHRVCNRGISADTIAGVLNRLDAVLDSPPRQLFLMIGINDLLSGSSIETVAQNYQQLFAAIQAGSPLTQVFVQSILPIHPQLLQTRVTNQTIATVNHKLHAIASQFAYQYVDLFSAFCDQQGWLDRQYTIDGLHLNGLAYQHWQQQILPLVSEQKARSRGEMTEITD